MPPLITRTEVEGLLDESFTPERFDAAYTSTLRVIKTAYKGDPEAATGHAADVVAGVVQSVLVRLLTNPKGARTVGLGSANVTFGGPDEDIARVFSLTDEEREDLAAVSPEPARRAAFTIRPHGGAT